MHVRAVEIFHASTARLQCIETMHVLPVPKSMSKLIPFYVVAGVALANCHRLASARRGIPAQMAQLRDMQHSLKERVGAVM